MQLEGRALHLCALPAATAPPAAGAWRGQTPPEPKAGQRRAGGRVRSGPGARNSRLPGPESWSSLPIDLKGAGLPA